MPFEDSAPHIAAAIDAFKGLHTRIAQLHAHHHDRLAEVMEACAASPCSGADILPVMFKRKLDVHQTTFAMGEAIAHLHKLWRDGDLRRGVDATGVLRFAATRQGLARLDAQPVAERLAVDLPVST